MAASRARPAARASERLARLTQRHEQDGADRGHQQDETLAEIADHAFLQRDDGGVEVEIAGDLLADGGLHDVQFGLRAGRRDAGPQAGGGPVVEIAHAELEVAGIVAERLVDFETFAEGASAGISLRGESGRTPAVRRRPRTACRRAGSCGRRWPGRPGSGGARANRRG